MPRRTTLNAWNRVESVGYGAPGRGAFLQRRAASPQGSSVVVRASSPLRRFRTRHLRRPLTVGFRGSWMRRGRYFASAQRVDHRCRPRLLQLGHVLAVLRTRRPRLLRRGDDAKPPTALRVRRHVCHRPDADATDSCSPLDLPRADLAELVFGRSRRVSRSSSGSSTAVGSPYLEVCPSPNLGRINAVICRRVAPVRRLT